MTDHELKQLRNGQPAEVKAVIDHLLVLRAEIRLIADFGLGFALCHRDFALTREAVRKEQDKLTTLADGQLPGGIDWQAAQRGDA